MYIKKPLMLTISSSQKVYSAQALKYCHREFAAWSLNFPLIVSQEHVCTICVQFRVSPYGKLPKCATFQGEACGE